MIARLARSVGTARQTLFIYAADIALDTSHSCRAHVTTHHDFSYFIIKLLRQTIAPVPLKISEACLRLINHNVRKTAHCMPSSTNIHSRVAAQHRRVPLWTGDRCTQRSQILLWCVVFRSALARYDVMPRCVLHRVCSCALTLPPCACVRSHACMLAMAEAPVSSVKELKTDQEYRSVLQEAAKTNALSVFDYTASWCGPCESVCT